MLKYVFIFNSTHVTVDKPTYTMLCMVCVVFKVCDKRLN